jgi:hypothetical protein
MTDEEIEKQYGKNCIAWMKHAKADGLKHLENLFADTVTSTITFFDKDFPNHSFDLSLKIRRRSADE